MVREGFLEKLVVEVEYRGGGGDNVMKRQKNKQDSCILSKPEFAKLIIVIPH